ncbi:MAG: spermidine synthase [Synoicihabitans sp.]
MKPRITLAEARTKEGRRLVLSEQDGAFAISLDGQELMHSRAHASELLLGELGAELLKNTSGARVLVGGLGLGFTLAQVLADLRADAVVDVAELMSEVVSWNREHLQTLNGWALDDPRVRLHIGDAAKLIQCAKPGTYDAMMLDIDNGPIAMVASGNQNLYSKAGLLSVKRALKTGGRVIFWSASKDAAFETRLEKAGFQFRAVPAKVHANAKRAAYLLYVASKNDL